MSGNPASAGTDLAPSPAVISSGKAVVAAARLAEGGRRRESWLDAVRGISGLLVVAYHSITTISPETIVFTEREFKFGRMGTVALFILSGYLLAGSFWRSPDTLAFYRTRLLRLFPLYLLSVAVLALVAMRTGSMGSFGLSDVLANATMAQHLLPVVNLQPFAWTMLPLVFLYAILPPVFFLKRHYGLLRMHLLGAGLVALLFVALPLVLHRSVPIALGIFAPAFSIGYILFEIDDGRIERRPAILATLVFVATAAAATWTNYDLLDRRHADHNTSLSLIGPFLAALGLFLLYRSRRVRPTPALEAIGRAGYPLYLFHLVPIEFLPGKFGAWYLLPLHLILAVILALLVHRLIETPLNRYLRARGTRALA